MGNARALSNLLPEPLLAAFSDFLAARVGLSFPPARWASLCQGLAAAAVEFGFDDDQDCVRWLMSAPLTREQVEILASHLTIGETYFFREPAAFAALEHHILPALIQARGTAERRLRFWSAGCSSGEEAYSISIVLQRLLPNFKDWNITLLASDINPRVLRKAQLGTYDNWSFRSAPPALKQDCFTRTSTGRFEIAAAIREPVAFAHLNLADDVYPSIETNTNAMDVIFCRNVLMYFEPARARAVIEKLSRSLIEGGWLVLGPVETGFVDQPELVAVNFPDLILYRKETSALNPLDDAGPRPTSINASGASPTAARLRTRVPAQRRRSTAPHARALSYQQAHASYAHGRYAEAANAARDALARDARDIAAMALLARACANQGRLDEAAAWCQRAVDADKSNPEWPYLLASILQEQGQTAPAMAALQRTLYLAYDHALAHFALGNLLRRSSRHDEATKHFRNALAALVAYRDDEVLPQSEGIIAGRLRAIIHATLGSGV